MKTKPLLQLSRFVWKHFREMSLADYASLASLAITLLDHIR